MISSGGSRQLSFDVASSGGWISYQNWKRSDRRDQKLAFSVYVAALDGEEQAATAYQRAVAQVATA